MSSTGQEVRRNLKKMKSRDSSSKAPESRTWKSCERNVVGRDLVTENRGQKESSNEQAAAESIPKKRSHPYPSHMSNKQSEHDIQLPDSAVLPDISQKSKSDDSGIETDGKVGGLDRVDYQSGLRHLTNEAHQMESEGDRGTEVNENSSNQMNREPEMPNIITKNTVGNEKNLMESRSVYGYQYLPGKTTEDGNERK